MKLPIVAGWCVLVLTSTAFAQTFEAPLRLAIQSDSIAVGDVNGDGLPDVLGVKSSHLLVQLAIAPGQFAPPLVYATGSVPGGGEKLAVGDFNGDRYADVAVSGFGSLQVFVGAAVGMSRIGAVPFLGGSIAAGDLNADGKVDLFVAPIDTSEGHYMSLLGDGRGGFSVLFTGYDPVMRHCHAVAIGDYNADGKTDAAAACQNAGVQMFAGRGDGTFALPVRAAGAPSTAIDVTAADFDRDGRSDLLVTGADQVAWWSEGSQARLLFGRDTGDAVAADLNRDGYLDAIAVSNEGRLYAGYGDGRGGFAPAVEVPYGFANTTELVAADLNLDGYPDLLAGAGSVVAMLYLPSSDDRARAATTTLARMETTLNGVSSAIGTLQLPSLGNLSALDAAISSRASQASVDALVAFAANLDAPVSSRASAGDLAALHGAIGAAVADAAAALRDAALRDAIEQALARGERRSTLYLPQAYGGMLERVQQVVQEECDRHGMAQLGVGRATKHIADGIALAQDGHYRQAFDAFAAAYQAIIK